MHVPYQFISLVGVVTTLAAPSRLMHDGSDMFYLAADPPGPTDISTSDMTTPTVPPASKDPNEVLVGTTNAQRGQLGGSVLGPNNIPIVLQNPDLLAPPTTDSGSV